MHGGGARFVLRVTEQAVLPSSLPPDKFDALLYGIQDKEGWRDALTLPESARDGAGGHAVASADSRYGSSDVIACSFLMSG